MNLQTLPIRFDDQGLVPAVMVDASSGDVLMIGFLNEQALQATRSTGFVHYWSRSRHKLWMKGETSGHTQEVVSIAVNCERNSLLIEVNQKGAVCHDGFPTCYYRHLEPDNSLSTVLDRWFDPADVYGDRSGLEALTKRWWGAYKFLRDNELESRSGTSRLLRDTDDRVTARVADELRELAGALDGSHRHVDLTSDVALEGGQVAYWIALRCIRDGVSWNAVRPDRAFDSSSQIAASASRSIGQLLSREAELWLADLEIDAAAMAHASLSLVAGACSIANVDSRSVIVADLNALRTRSYLEPYFATLEEDEDASDG